MLVADALAEIQPYSNRGTPAAAGAPDVLFNNGVTHHEEAASMRRSRGFVLPRGRRLDQRPGPRYGDPGSSTPSWIAPLLPLTINMVSAIPAPADDPLLDANGNA